MSRIATKCFGVVCLLLAGATDLRAQKPPYDVFPPADPPYYRVRYEASDKPGELPYAVNYTIWIPPGVKALRGVLVHQHGCGEGSCKSGLTGAYDLHWQALAKKHDCALLSPSYEQPEKADCQMWCDPRNGSDVAFQKCLADLGTKSGHPELAKAAWALWGHSGGGDWAGGMVMLHPDRVAAAWLRSGVPILEDDPNRKGIRAHTLAESALKCTSCAISARRKASRSRTRTSPLSGPPTRRSSTRSAARVGSSASRSIRCRVTTAGTSATSRSRGSTRA